LVGLWSPIHLLSIFSPAMLVVGVMVAHVSRHEDDGVDFCRRADHRGRLGFMPGRVMHAVVFGPLRD